MEQPKEPYEYIAYVDDSMLANGTVFAAGHDKAKQAVLLKLGKEHADISDDVEVRVRPFGGG